MNNSKFGQELEKIENLAKACGDDGQRIIENGLLVIKTQLLKKVNDDAFGQRNNDPIQKISISEKLKKVRMSLGYDQQTLADILNISRPTYSRIESNINDVGSSNLSLLFYKLQISPLWFFYDIGPIFFDERKEKKNES